MLKGLSRHVRVDYALCEASSSCRRLNENKLATRHGDGRGPKALNLSLRL